MGSVFFLPGRNWNILSRIEIRSDFFYRIICKLYAIFYLVAEVVSDFIQKLSKFYSDPNTWVNV
jgi:hypothetical protein